MSQLYDLPSDVISAAVELLSVSDVVNALTLNRATHSSLCILPGELYPWARILCVRNWARVLAYSTMLKSKELAGFLLSWEDTSFGSAGYLYQMKRLLRELIKPEHEVVLSRWQFRDSSELCSALDQNATYLHGQDEMSLGCFTSVLLHQENNSSTSISWTQFVRVLSQLTVVDHFYCTSTDMAVQLLTHGKPEDIRRLSRKGYLTRLSIGTIASGRILLEQQSLSAYMYDPTELQLPLAMAINGAIDESLDNLRPLINAGSNMENYLPYHLHPDISMTKKRWIRVGQAMDFISKYVKLSVEDIIQVGLGFGGPMDSRLMAYLWRRLLTRSTEEELMEMLGYPIRRVLSTRLNAKRMREFVSVDGRIPLALNASRLHQLLSNIGEPREYQWMSWASISMHTGILPVQWVIEAMPKSIIDTHMLYRVLVQLGRPRWTVPEDDGHDLSTFKSVRDQLLVAVGHQYSVVGELLTLITVKPHHHRQTYEHSASAYGCLLRAIKRLAELDDSVNQEWRRIISLLDCRSTEHDNDPDREYLLEQLELLPGNLFFIYSHKLQASLPISLIGKVESNLSSTGNARVIRGVLKICQRHCWQIWLLSRDMNQIRAPETLLYIMQNSPRDVLSLVLNPKPFVFKSVLFDTSVWMKSADMHPQDLRGDMHKMLLRMSDSVSWALYLGMDDYAKSLLKSYVPGKRTELVTGIMEFLFREARWSTIRMLTTVDIPELHLMMASKCSTFAAIPALAEILAGTKSSIL